MSSVRSVYFCIPSSTTTLITHDLALIRGRPTLEHEHFRTGPFRKLNNCTERYSNVAKCYLKSDSKCCLKCYSKCCSNIVTTLKNDKEINNTNNACECCDNVTNDGHLINIFAKSSNTFSSKIKNNPVHNGSIVAKGILSMQQMNVSTDHCVRHIINQINGITKFTKNNRHFKLNKMKHPPRSRHSLFYLVCSEDTHKHATTAGTTKVGCQFHLCHDHAPSRIPVRWITWCSRKTLLKKLVKHKFKYSVPRSSQIHIICNAINIKQETLQCYPHFNCFNFIKKRCTVFSAKNSSHIPHLADIFYASESCHDLYALHVYKNLYHMKNVGQSALCINIEINPGPTFDIDLCKTISAPYSQNNQAVICKTAGQQCLCALSKKATYKDQNHRINYCKLSLSVDIEVNPGPGFVNPAKTIHVPYSQGNVDLFGENAGRQCVAMSLCSLIYVHRKGSILDSTTLVNIMNLGNDLYSMLSRLSRQSYLLLTEIPTMVTVQDTDYSFEFSESYTANLHYFIASTSIPFVMPLHSALEQLQQETFNSFLLTIEQNTISIFTDSNGILKVFDSHARDSFGMPHPHGNGTCVLLEFDSISDLTEYFKTLYRFGVVFELVGVKIIDVSCNNQLHTVNLNETVTDSSTTNNNINYSSSTAANDTSYENYFLYTEDCSIYIYSICFCTIMKVV